MAELLSKTLVILNVADGQDGKPGTDGVSGTSYYVHIRYSKYSDGTDFSTNVDLYVGIYTGTSKTAPTDKSEYQWSRIEGIDGTSISIKETKVEYQKGTSGTSQPIGTWETTIPTMNTGEYLWTKTTVEYSDGQKTESYSCSYWGINGKDGTSVKITETSVKYQSGTSGVDKPTGDWQTTIPTIALGNYLWTQTIVTYSDGSKTETYTCARQGINGTDGKDGTSITITGTSVKYLSGESGINKPTGDWQDAIPTVAQGDFLWTLTIVNYSDGSKTESYSCSRQGTDGTDGKDGTSPTITSTVNEYQQSDNGTEVPIGEWSASPPEAESGKYIWTRTTITYSDNKTSISYSVSKNGTNGQSTYVDIRYSNDGGATFTDNNGTVPGDYIGIYVTTDSSVQSSGYVPKVENYTWKKITGEPVETFYYKLDYNYNNIYKFYTGSLQAGKYSYSYTPATLKTTLQKVSSSSIVTETDFIIEARYNYYDEAGTLQTGKFKETSNEGVIELDLTKEDYQKYNLQTISFIVKNDEGQILSDIIDVVWGMTEDMAKFSLNATDIVQSILDTKLIFNSDGLTVKNGSFTIINNNNEKVFRADDEGNLFFTGKINSTSGNLAGWVIEESNIHDIESKVGLYSGKEVSYLLEESPARFWAGKEDNNFKFAVTEAGKIYATDILLRGTLQSQNAKIANKLFVGNENNGVVIYGGENSYISSAQYASGQLGYGWRINQDGSAEFSNITARGKIESSVFEYNKVSSVGGSLYIAPTIYMGNDTEAISKDSSGNYVIKWVSTFTNSEDICGHTWTTDDFVKINGEVLLSSAKESLSGVDATIQSITKEDGYVVFIFNIKATSSSQDLTGGYLASGGTIILYGTSTKKQGLYLTAADTGAPYIDVYDAEVNSNVVPAVRLGNLSGVSDSNFPNGKLEGYGLYSSNAYLRGQLVLPGAGITNQTDITYGEDNDASPIRIWAGNDGSDITKSNFIVTADGSLYAKQGIFEGTVKATNSEFSGTIRTAGVVIDENGTGENPLPAKNHFFVAYTSEPSTFNDYVLDIGEHGLSIWEGALRAYSDFASGENNYTTPYTDDIYGYDKIKPSTMPLPYFTLVDNGTENELDARIVAHKGHFANIKKIGENYIVNSLVASNGLWFGKNSFSKVSKEMENTSYYNIINQMNNGVYYDNDIMSLKGTTINLESKRGYFNYSSDEIQETQANGLHIKGLVSISPDGADNIITMGKQVIREHYKDNVSIGFDFIVS